MKHTYILNGTQILGEKWADKMMLYVYDEAGAPLGIKYRTNSYVEGVFDYYFFEKNLQGDIVSIYRATDYGKICTYNYDAWGNFTISTPSGIALTAIDTQIVTLNPFRYRGYYYDNETGFYYLQSRYYNPEWGRFISADGQISGVGADVRGNNIYIYCLNNPISLCDPDGKWPKWIEEIGKRFVHTMDIMAQILVSPFKAITADVGIGIGLGAKVHGSINDVSVEVAGVSSITDSIVYEEGRFDVQNKTETNIGFNVGDIFDFSYKKGHKHSYYADNCTCDFLYSPYVEKSECVANESYSSKDSSIGIGGGYFIIGIEFSISIDLAAWNRELNLILDKSLEYGGT